MTSIRFVKMEGAGNDYIYVDAVRQPFPMARGPELARRWADRHFGIGGDGLILLAASTSADVRMIMWNADGSRSETCGNGLRCVGKLAVDIGLVEGDRARVETDAGVCEVRLELDRGEIVGAEVDMGRVTVADSPETATVAGRDVRFHAGEAGNPHAVVFIEEDPEDYPVVEVGAALQMHSRFPRGVNVEFVRVLDDGTLRQRTYERGSGETMACGSGATVAALAALQTRRVGGPDVVVRLRGGSLTIRRHGSSLVMGGPARTVFTGEVELGPP